jgi:Ca2+-binding EF-hand superfamily protein
MRRIDTVNLAMMFTVICLCFSPSHSFAQSKGPPTEMIKGAYQEILKSCDTDKDGKLTVQECMGAFKDKVKAEKDCKYWDANGDGTITEEEYVGQVRKIMK